MTKNTSKSPRTKTVKRAQPVVAKFTMTCNGLLCACELPSIPPSDALNRLTVPKTNLKGFERLAERTALFGRLLSLHQVDEIEIRLLPRIGNGKRMPTITGLPIDFLPKAVTCRLAKMDVVGDECLLRYRII